MTRGKFWKWALWSVGGFVLLVAALIVTAPYRTNVYLVVENGTAAPILISRLTYADTVLAKDLTVAPKKWSKILCRSQSYWNTLHVEFVRAEEAVPTHADFVLERWSSNPPLVVPRVQDAQVTVEGHGSAAYFTASNDPRY